MGMLLGEGGRKGLGGGMRDEERKGEWRNGNMAEHGTGVKRSTWGKED